MAVSGGTTELGPSTARLRLRTSREGVAAKVGHDLEITFETWSGRLTLDGADLAAASVQAEFDVASIKIVTGTGGALPLTDRDRAEIRKTARRLLDVDRNPTATFVSTSVAGDDAGGTIDGTLTVRGETAPVQVAVSRRDDMWRGSATIKQSSFGIKPYRAFLGALRLADEVQIEVELATVLE